jgi:hypothetical protein
VLFVEGTLLFFVEFIVSVMFLPESIMQKERGIFVEGILLFFVEFIVGVYSWSCFYPNLTCKKNGEREEEGGGREDTRMDTRTRRLIFPMDFCQEVASTFTSH